MKNIDRFKDIDFVAGIMYDHELFDRETCSCSTLLIDGECPVTKAKGEDFTQAKEDCKKCIKAWLESEVEE